MAKIMLVEDDRSLQEIYSIRLVAEGYEIARADDGEEALAKAVQEKPDLIIADVMMPKISGFDMLDILRSQPETQNIKVIMMTALSSDDQRQRGEALGAERYLVKSQVGIEDVVNTVHEVLGDKPNENAKANIETLSNIPAPQAGAPAPVPTESLNNVQTTPTTVIQPADPATGPAPMPQTPINPTGGEQPNFNQAPVATPGVVPVAQNVANPATGAVVAQAAQPVGTIPIAIQQVPQVMPMAPLPQLQVPPMAPKMQTMAPQAAVPMPAMGQPQQNAAQPTEIKEEKTSGGERVIQPIHDPRVDNIRSEMQERMAEILGEDADDGVPHEINTKTARNTKPAPQSTTPPAQNQTPVATTQEAAAPQPQPTAPQQPQPTAAQAPVQPPAAKQEPVAQPEKVEQPEIAQSAAPEAPKPQQDSNVASNDVAENKEEPTEAIQPGYIAQLTDDLSADLNSKANGEMSNRMAAELQNDEITKEALEKAKATTEAVAAQAAQEQPAKVEPMPTLAPLPTGPNIAVATSDQVQAQAQPQTQAPTPAPIATSTQTPTPALTAAPAQGQAPIAAPTSVGSTPNEVSGSIPH